MATIDLFSRVDVGTVVVLPARGYQAASVAARRSQSGTGNLPSLRERVSATKQSPRYFAADSSDHDDQSVRGGWPERRCRKTSLLNGWENFSVSRLFWKTSAAPAA